MYTIQIMNYTIQVEIIQVKHFTMQIKIIQYNTNENHTIEMKN